MLNTKYHGVCYFSDGVWNKKHDVWCCIGFKGLFYDAEEAAVYFDLWNLDNNKGYPLNFPEIVDVIHYEKTKAAIEYSAKELTKQIDKDILKCYLEENTRS